MTLYRFNGPARIPYYDLASFLAHGPTAPAGHLAQGSSLIPCLVVKNGQALTDANGVPYVGFQVVVDAGQAGPEAKARFLSARQKRQGLMVQNHHCPADAHYVLDVRNLHDLQRPPFFEPPAKNRARQPDSYRGTTDLIVRSFHNSPHCAAVNSRLTGRREAMHEAWAAFTRQALSQWPREQIERARHLDYTMRTAIFEGHLGRGCSAYGVCERNIIALSIRNRARESCFKHHACAAPGDFTSVASAVSQYNIWDEYVTQVSGLTGCFLREDATSAEYRLYKRLYAQNVGDVERILFGSDSDLMEIFPGNSLTALKGLKNYYHAPAMGQCFPQYERMEFMTGAVARNGADFALIADVRLLMGQKKGNAYLFRTVRVSAGNKSDHLKILDNYPNFLVDARRVTLKKATRCTPYGIPRGCEFAQVGRYRKTPVWGNEGRPMEVHCRVASRGAQCLDAPKWQNISVGGVCDVEMRPYTGID